MIFVFAFRYKDARSMAPIDFDVEIKSPDKYEFVIDFIIRLIICLNCNFGCAKYHPHIRSCMQVRNSVRYHALITHDKT